jgi:glycosyltransferase involved in cell wall biosynthesis
VVGLEHAELASVVLPCLNESGIIGPCVTEALTAFAKAGMACEVIVADNGSTDGSGAEAEQAGARVISVPRRGYGSAVTAAIEASRGDVILTSDADGTYPLKDGPELVRLARTSDAIVLGSRFSGAIAKGAMPFLHRVVGSPATRWLLRLLFGVKCSDPHSGMRAMKRSVFERVRPQSMGWEFTVEMLVNATRQSVTVTEVPIEFGERTGESKLRALPEGWAFFRFLLLRSPTYLFVLPGLVSFAAGLAMVAWLAGADRSLGRVTLGINTLVVGVLLAAAGYQLVALGLCARIYVSDAHPGDDGSWARPVMQLFTLERGIGLGVLVGIVGIGLVGDIGGHWVAGGFGALDRADHGVTLVGFTVALIGLETIFSSFFLALILSLIDPTKKRPTERAAGLR